MTTALITHPDCALHETPPGHPEQVARLRAILEALEGADLWRVEAPLAGAAEAELVHPASYVARIIAEAPKQGSVQVDPDTHMSPGSLNAAWRALGGALRAVDLVLGGEAGNAFSACRPPGHHAEREQAMGFCLFGNVAAAAKHALAAGLTRVAIVDFDVHHGNGTQDLVQDDPRILFASSHEMPLYPGTGDPAERGPHDTILNLALPAGCDGAHFRSVYEAEILPRVDAFAPELLLISAGFDAHADDPLASCQLDEADFTWVTERLCDLADAHCAGRVVSLLEGGYNLDALGRSARAHVDVLRRRGA